MADADIPQRVLTFKYRLLLKRGQHKALENCLIIYAGKHYNITGLLSTSTTFSLSIDGPFGKEELDVLIKKLQLDADALKIGKFNEFHGLDKALESIRQAANPHPATPVER